jgi:hypothetical protein
LSAGDSRQRTGAVVPWVGILSEKGSTLTCDRAGHPFGTIYLHI